MTYYSWLTVCFIAICVIILIALAVKLIRRTRK